jgi:6,7-dimethyl-8-ribityllumazine synthase
MFGAEKGKADRWTARSCTSASCRPASTKASPTRWPACLAELEALGVPASTSPCARARRAGSAGGAAGLAEKDEYDALIALGCIIRGETYHFELVANESGAGVSRVALDYQLPVANAILTTENLEQAVGPPDRQGPRRRPRGGGDGQPAGRAVMSEHHAPSAAPAAQTRASPAPADRHRRAQGGVQVGRSRAREFALQALYQHLVGGNAATRHRLPSRATWRAFTRPTRALRRPAARLHRQAPSWTP